MGGRRPRNFSSFSFALVSLLALSAPWWAQSSSAQQARWPLLPAAQASLATGLLNLSGAGPEAADPADSVCARSASGSVVSDPPVVASTNGVLEVTFHYQTTVDLAGLTRYCYVYTDPTGTANESPTLEVNPGDQVILHFFNDLPAASAAAQAAGAMAGMKMHPAASSADAACAATSVTSVSTNVHFHGSNLPPVCHQDEVVHTLIQPQDNFDYQVQIPANEPPGIYWYHPHPHGYSDPQVIGGATGVLLVQGVENVNSAVAGLPQRLFVIRDQNLPAAESGDTGILQTDLSLNYVPILYSTGYTPAVIQTAPAEQEFWRVANTAADTMINLEVVANGVAQPLQIVSIDGVPLVDANGNGTTLSTTSYVLSPATRVEFIVTTPALGATAQLMSTGWNNGPSGDADPARPLATITSVAATAAASSTAAVKGGAAIKGAVAQRVPAVSHPYKLGRFQPLDTTAAVTQRLLYFSVKPDFSEFYLTVDGQTPAVFNMDGPPDITVTEGTVEQWTIENRSTMDHNFHIHQLHFQTLSINGIAANDTTRRDTINVPHWSGNASDPYPSVTLMMDFRNPDIVGTFVYHCHILSHEDRGMMGMIQVLPGATTTTLTAAPTTSPAGASVVLTAVVAPDAGAGTPTGTVTFLNGATTLGAGTLDATGTATLSVATLPIGAETVTAAYSGDTSFVSSTSTGTVVTVTPAVTMTVLTVAPATIVSGANLALTALVTATAGTGTPTGSVSFLNGMTTLGTGMLDGTGTATLATAALTTGTASLTAVYAGTASFAASTSAAVPVVVTAPPPPDFGLTTKPAALTVTAGSSGTSTLTITPLNGFTTAVTFACSGLPSEASCSFSPATVTPDGTNAITTTVTVTTTGASSMLNDPFGRPGAPLYAMVLPGLGLMLALNRWRRHLPPVATRLGMVLIAMVVTLAIGACGGGSSTPKNPGTPAGTSTVTVTATSGSESHTATVALTVQ